MSALSPDELLQQALELVRKKAANQADLRRSVSTAYYALFHLLVSASAEALAPGKSVPLQALLARAFGHEEMAQACRTFASRGPLPTVVSALYTPVIPQQLREVAQALVDLQKARHDADYGTHRVWTPTEAATEVARAEQAIKDWLAVRQLQQPPDIEAANLFLTWLAFGKTLTKR